MSIIPNTMSIHELLYDDYMNVLRENEDYINENGVNEPIDMLIHEKKKCKLSMTSRDNPSDTEDGWRPKISVHKIFTNPSIEILAGDIIEVYRLNRTTNEFYLAYKGFANKPNIYFSHQEIEISEEKIN